MIFRESVFIGLRRPVAAAIAAALMANAAPAGAVAFEELSEAALAEMRGKFVVGRHVQYFAGVTGTHEVELRFQVDNSGPATKVAYAVGGTLGDQVADTPAPAPGAAVTQIDGAVQAIQVEGSDNVVQNNVGYAVIPANAAPVLGDAEVASAVPTAQTFRNGDMVTQVATGDGLGFTIISAGNQVTQRLGMNPVTNHSQLLQAVRLTGDGHRIVNDLMLQVAFENAVSQRDGTRFRADQVMNLL